MHLIRRELAPKLCDHALIQRVELVLSLLVRELLSIPAKGRRFLGWLSLIAER